jgi:hypothetical protein
VPGTRGRRSITELRDVGSDLQALRLAADFRRNGPCYWSGMSRTVRMDSTAASRLATIHAVRILEHRRLGIIATLAPLIVVCMLLAACSNLGNRDGGDGEASEESVSEESVSEESVSEESVSEEPVSEEPVSEEPLSSEGFTTPSENIGCKSFEGGIRCDILSGLKPDPGRKFPEICPLDWTGVYINPGVDAGPTCAGDSVMDPDDPTLEYGQTWSRGDLTCDSESSRLRCVDTAGNGFTLARRGWTLLGKEAAATAAFDELRRKVRADARRSRPGEVVRVEKRPSLVGGSSCRPMQEAAVAVEFSTSPSPVVYFECYVSGGWVNESIALDAN